MTGPARPRRGALIVLVIAVFLGCLALGWWQWERFSTAGGTFQNLGYALQWPLFAVFAVYAYRRFVLLEAGQDPEQLREKPAAELPAGVLPERPPPASDAASTNDDMSAYNAYLAALAADDTRSQP